MTDAERNEVEKLNDFATEHWNAITEMPSKEQQQYLLTGRMAAEGILCALAAGDVNLVDALRRLMEVNHCVGSVAWVYITDREDWMPPLRAMELFSSRHRQGANAAH